MADSYASTGTDAITKRQQLDRLRADLWTERSTFEAHWKELGDYFLPRRPRFFTSDRNKGDRRNQNIIDSTGKFAARTLQSGLHAGLTSPARPWMKLSTPDPDLAELGPIKAWLHTVTQRMLTVFLQSNLYNALPVLYGDLGVFGTAAMAVIEDEHDTFRCYTYPIGSYAIGLDERGIATSFVREYVLTIWQLVKTFGTVAGSDDIDWTKFSQNIKTQWDRSNYQQTVEVSWIVTPNPDVDPGKLDWRAFPWQSCYFEKGSTEKDRFLRESGFREFPIMAPRWDVTGEDTYGTDCPGMTALGDTKALQTMQKRKAQAIEKLVNPPLIGPTMLRTQKTSLLPGDITYADTREGMQGLKPIHEVKPDLQHFVLDIRETQYRIQRAFYEDLFLMLASSDQQRGMQPLTAREIDERHEEKLLALGPVLERTNDELLDPLVDRVYAMMDKAGLIPPAPLDLHGVKLRVEYTSLMAQAQKLVGVVGNERLTQYVEQMVAVIPEAQDGVDFDELVRAEADALGVNPKILRAPEQVAAIREARGKAQQAAAQAQQLKDAGAGAKALGTTPMDQGDTALTRLIEGAPAA